MSYTFRYTEENGYKRVHISKKDHNALFINRQIKWSDKYEYLLNEEKGHLVILRLRSLPVKVFITAFYPIILLLHGLANFEEVNKDIINLWNQKKSGSFSADDCHENDKDWDCITRAIRTKQRD